MAKIRDRTEDFKDAVQRVALSLEYDESKMAATMASFIMHKPRQRSPFTKAAMKTLESIGELEQFLMKHKKDYVDMHRTTEQEKDGIEHEVTIFIKACKEQIDVLRAGISDDEANAKGWLGIRGDNSNADTIAHKHGVVLILSERLHVVTSQFDQLRAIRFQDAINRAMPRRKLKKVAKAGYTNNSKLNTVEERTHINSDIADRNDVQAEPIRVQHQILDDDTRALQVELSGLLNAAQETETKMVEMSALNHLMSTHVLQQAQQIELLYEQAVEATKNVELGNKELSQAIRRNSSNVGATAARALKSVFQVEAEFMNLLLYMAPVGVVLLVSATLHMQLNMVGVELAVARDENQGQGTWSRSGHLFWKKQRRQQKKLILTMINYHDVCQAVK